MPISQPFRRTSRQLVDGSYSSSGNGNYVKHDLYAKSPEHYIRASLLLLKDVQELFDYVEPADANLACYSYRIHELLLRICVEVEANCKAILTENKYAKGGRWNIDDYRKIDASHRLSEYEIKFPVWNGTLGTRTPFATWANQGTNSPLWYRAYNATKHDRHNEFPQATFQHMTEAFAGLCALLAAQFHTEDFSPEEDYIAAESNDGLERGIGGYLRVKFPAWPANERYDFDWKAISKTADPFQDFPYPT